MAYSAGVSNPFGFVVTPWVKKLLIANVVVFLITYAFGGLVEYLQFSPSNVIPWVWTPITYMFVHGGFFHLLFNMLVLFFFGPPLEERWGSRQFVKFYLIAGLGGALLSVLFPYPIIGASGAIYGIMVAFAYYWPDNPIYIWGIFPIKAKWLVGFLVGLDLFYALGGGGSEGVARLAHLGGAFTAFGYLKSPWAPPAWGSIPTKPRRKRPRNWNVFSGLGKTTPEPDNSTTRPVVAAAKRAEAHRALDEVDRILDKINEGGISSLTEDERRRLEEASRKFKK